MDKSLKTYIKDLALTLVIAQCPEDQLNKIKYSKIFNRTLKALNNYASLRLKLMQNSKIIEVEHKLLKAAFKSALKSVCKSYNINLSDELIASLADEHFEALLHFIHNIRCDLFIDLQSFAIEGMKSYENK